VRPAKSFVVRIVLYSVALLYLAGDLFVFHGPVLRKIRSARPDSPESLERAKARGMVAQVFGHPIHRDQVERAARERVWLRGLSLDELTPAQRRTERLAALNELVDHTLLRVKVQYNQDEFPISEEEVDEAVRRLAARYPGRDALLEDLRAEGIDSEKELRLRLGARIQQAKYLEERIGEGIAVGEDEAREWFEEHAGDFAMPERVRVRHVFRSTLRHSAGEARATLDKALSELRAGTRGFAELASELSEDPRSRGEGGELGWMSEERLPADFGKPVFAMKPGRAELVRTKLGWHLVEVMERKPRALRSFEAARDEVLAALEAWKREVMVREFRNKLREQDAIAVHVFPELVTGE